MKLQYLAAVALMAITGTARAATIYSTDFTSGTGNFTGAGVAAVTPSGEHYLELYNSNAATLTVSTAGYTGLTVKFNLYGIESVDGNGPAGGGPDPFQIFVNGAATPTYDINIANFSGGNTQSYNGDLSQSGPGHTYDPLTGATAQGTLGYGTGSFGDSTYVVTFTLPDSAVTTLRFVGATNESAVDSNGSTAGNEAYGIDNFALTGTAVSSGVPSGVPEPASWAMMVGGFGLVGGALRRRAPGGTVAHA